MEKLVKILSEIKADVDFCNERDLIKAKALDSLTIMEIVSRLCEEYNMDISPREIAPENFKNLETIKSMIERNRTK